MIALALGHAEQIGVAFCTVIATVVDSDFQLE